MGRVRAHGRGETRRLGLPPDGENRLSAKRQSGEDDEDDDGTQQREI